MVSSYDTRKEKRKEKKNENYHYFFYGKIIIIHGKENKGENYHIYSLMVLAHHNLIYKQLATKIKPLNTTKFCFSFIILVEYTVS